MLRLLRQLLIFLLTLLVLVAGAVSILTLSEPGSRWLVGQVLDRVPGEHRVGSIHGRLVSGLRLVDVDYRLERTAAHTDLLVLRWQPADLLQGTLRVRELLLQNASLTTAKAETDSGPLVVPEQIALPLTLVVEELRIEQLQLDTGGEQTRIDSVVLAARAGPLQGLKVRNFTLRMQDSRLQLSGRAALRKPYAFKGRLDWHTGLPDGVEAAGQASLDGDMNTVHLDHTLSQPFQVATRGSVQLDAPSPVVALRGQWQAIQWPLSGPADYSSAHGEYSVDGTLSAYRITLSGPLAGRDIPEAQVRASGTGNGQGLHIESLALDTLGGHAVADGNLAWTPHFTLGLSIRGKQLDPGRHWPTGSGQLDLDAQLEVDVGERGTLVALRELDLRGTLQGRALSGRGALIFDNGIASTPGLTVEAGANRASLSGALDAGGLSYRITAPQLSTLLPELEGGLQAEGRLTGPLERLAGDITLTATDLAYQDNRAGRLQARVQVDTDRPQAGRLTLETQDLLLGARPVEALTLNADGTLDSHTASLRLTAARGSAELHAQGGYGGKDWSGYLDTATLALADAGNWHLREPVALRIDSRHADPFDACWVSEEREVCLQGDWQGDSAQLHLSAHAAEGHARGDIALSGLQQERPRLAGRIDANIPDIRFLDPLLPDARIVAGTVTAQAELKGHLDAPEIIGSATLSGAALGVDELGLTITDITLQAHGGGRGVALTGSARSGEGEIALNGKIILDPQRDWPFEIQLKGERFAISQLPDTEIAANPDLRLQGSTKQVDVSGDVLIPRARITLKQLPPEVVRVSVDQVIVGPAASPEAAPASNYAISLNVVATLGNDVHFEGLGLSTDLGGSLNVRTLRTATLIGNGILELREGRYEGYGQKLTIEQGRLLFAGPLDNPALDVRATRKVDNVVAGIELYGTAEVPQTRLFSTPSLSDAEILSYLVTGKPLGASSTGADSQALAAAAASLGANSPVAQEISQKLGIELGVQSGTTDADTSLVVSKQLSSRLSIDYVYGLFNESAALQFIYELTDNLSLTGQSGTVQSIDLKYSIDRP